MPEALELLVRRAAVAPRSIDDGARTLRVTISTGAPVRRRDIDGPYVEILSTRPEHVDLSRLEGAAVLNSHQQGDLSKVLGVVIDSGIDREGVWADLKISSRADVEPYWQDIRAGILKFVSIGYAVVRWEDGAGRNGERRRTAVRWAPVEVSFVPVPADPQAKVRSLGMEDEEHTTTDAGEVETTTTTPDATRAAVHSEIRSITRVAGLGSEFADQLIDRGASADDARRAAFDEMSRRANVSIDTHRIEVGHSHDEPATRLRHMGDALLCRMVPTEEPNEAARPYMNASLMDMARDLLRLRGDRVSMLSADEVLTRAMHTTSDFPTLLKDSGHRSLMQAYSVAPNPLKRLARRALASDFRTLTRVRAGEMGRLEKVGESGEVKGTTRGEAKESYRVETFARTFALSRQAIINDDLGAFSDWTTTMGRSAAETEAYELVALLTQNAGGGPKMDDTKNLFHADHGNLAGAGAAISVATLSDARSALRGMKGLDGVTPINATPKFLLVSKDKETEAEQALASIYAATPSDANPFTSRLEPLVESRLGGNGWYVFADPAVLPVIEYAHLSSAQGPQMRSREGWDTLGMEFQVVLDFGCGALDHRGAYRNPGN